MTVPVHTISTCPRGVCWHGPLRTSTTRKTRSCFCSPPDSCAVRFDGGQRGGSGGGGMGTEATGETKDGGETMEQAVGGGGWVGGDQSDAGIYWGCSCIHVRRSLLGRFLRRARLVPLARGGEIAIATNSKIMKMGHHTPHSPLALLAPHLKLAPPPSAGAFRSSLSPPCGQGRQRRA